ncbi:hypothetical protein ASG11_10725 [Sphingomonas sp. Leaf357]|uniref:hypothetical protein n=1 Tax=Sphingomonadaceae TaxID=41297 RepID=UPI0006F417D6|nr:hypothetical protein [Sphingomonas sp. Leaf357]KQS05317.1 hypothetical protein ASG11_10725 [Sphingomonas sp. Leaf357]
MTTLTAERPPAAVPTTTPILFEAIVRKMCIAATYNKVEMTLAPHVIYTKHDELFIDAEVLARDGKPPKEPKIGTFKLVGLTGVRITPRAFTVSALFDQGSFKYADTTLMAVEPD